MRHSATALVLVEVDDLVLDSQRLMPRERRPGALRAFTPSSAVTSR
jgi:hypothetical protein